MQDGPLPILAYVPFPASPIIPSVKCRSIVKAAHPEASLLKRNIFPQVFALLCGKIWRRDIQWTRSPISFRKVTVKGFENPMSHFGSARVPAAAKRRKHHGHGRRRNRFRSGYWPCRRYHLIAHRYGNCVLSLRRRRRTEFYVRTRRSFS